ncbi:MAG: VWA domain-containing protein [Pseudorhodobacter sp.]|nr:MAG: VWA domain-containing protein [Pseudorhodobacter sp.]
MAQSMANRSEDASDRTASRKRFRRAEDGSLTIFALCLFMLMAMIGGITVDLMRYETTRTTLQNTLDRATLAAAALSQQLDGEDVVTDYFAKAGMSQYLKAVTVEEGLNYREVVADAEAATNPFFLHLIGVDEMEAPGHSMAEQRMTNVEIMLVLDVSGSMNSNNRLTNLKTAAKEFVDTVLSSDDEDRISIGIVPFNGQVDLGSALVNRYNVTKKHYASGVSNDMNCVDLPSSVYSSTGISTTVDLPMTTPTDTYSSTNKTNGYVDRQDTSYATNDNFNRWCPDVDNKNSIMLPSQSISALQNKIQNLYGVGATSINAGMKWGMALLDPGTQGVFDFFVGNGTIPAVFEGRPFEFTDPESMKVVVLMTDGEHFAEDRLKDKYKAGTTGLNGTQQIFKSPFDGNYSIRFTSGRPGSAGWREYWVPHRSEWRALPWTNSSDTNAATLQPITFEKLWGEVRLQWVVWQLYARALGTNTSTRASQYNTWIAEFREQTAIGTMDSQLQSMCAKAKENGVTVYGIAFEAPTNGRTQISQCATSAAHYFNASGLQIRTAFRAIASNISHLRLTQ